MMRRAVALLAERTKHSSVAYDPDCPASVEKRVLEVINTSTFNFQSTPGNPLNNIFKKNADALSEEGIPLLTKLVVDRLVKIHKLTEEEIDAMSPQEAIARNLVDPISIFVKEEPNPERKLLTKTVRIVCAVSLVTQTIERVFFEDLADKQILSWDTIPLKAGIGFDKANLEKFIRGLPEKIRRGVVDMDDVSGYDFSRKLWQNLMYIDYVNRMIDACSATHSLIRKFEKLMMKQIFVNGNGKMFMIENEDGELIPIQLSGRFMTIFQNSVVRVLVSYLYQMMALGKADDEVAAIAAGDDCAASGSDTKPETMDARKKWHLEVAGWKLTDVVSTENSNKLEFCSHVFDLETGDALPLNWGKTLFRFLNKDPARYSESERFEFVKELKRLTEKQIGPAFRDIIVKAGWGEDLNRVEGAIITTEIVKQMSNANARPRNRQPNLAGVNNYQGGQIQAVPRRRRRSKKLTLGNSSFLSGTKMAAERAKRERYLAKVESRTATRRGRKIRVRKSDGNVTDVHRDHFRAAAEYIHAAFNPSVRGALPPTTNNPVKSLNAVPFQTVAVWSAGLTGMTNLQFAFPLGHVRPSPTNPMDGNSFHSLPIPYKFSADTYRENNATGPCDWTYDGSTHYTGLAAVMSRIPQTLGGGAEYVDANYSEFPTTTGPSLERTRLLWNQNFPIEAVYNASGKQEVHLRWAMVSAELKLTNDTPIGNRGGYWIIWEPSTNQIPPLNMSDFGGGQVIAPLNNSLIEDLPTFHVVPADMKEHRYVVRGRTGARDFWHDTKPAAIEDLLAENAFPYMGLYCVFINTTPDVQAIRVELTVNWAVAGPITENLGTRTKPASLAAPAMTATLDAVREAQVPMAKATEHVLSSLPDASARSNIMSHVANYALGAAKAFGTSVVTNLMN